MKKEVTISVKNDIKSLKRVRRIVSELFFNSSADSQSFYQQEEFLQLYNVRLFLDKTIIRLEKLANKASNP